MTADPADRRDGWPDSALRPAHKAPPHLLVVADISRNSLHAATYAAQIAAELRCGVTVALLIERPRALALMPYDLSGWPDDDAEIDAVIWLARILDPYGVPWRLEPVTDEALPTISMLAGRRHVRWLVVARRRWLPALHRTSRIADVLGRRHGLPVLVVPAE